MLAAFTCLATPPSMPRIQLLLLYDTPYDNNYDLDRRHREIVDHMTAGTVAVRDMGKMGKELGRLEAVLAKQAAVTEKASETRDLEEARRKIAKKQHNTVVVDRRSLRVVSISRAVYVYYTVQKQVLQQRP